MLGVFFEQEEDASLLMRRQSSLILSHHEISHMRKEKRMENPESRMGFWREIECPPVSESSSKERVKRVAIIALAAILVFFAMAWAGAGPKPNAYALAAVAREPDANESRLSSYWSVTVTFGDGTIATGGVAYDSSGAGRSVNLRVDLSCGHTHTLYGTQDADRHMHGDGDGSTVPDHDTSNASVRASSRNDIKMSASGSSGEPKFDPPSWEADYNPGPEEEYKK